LPLKERIEQAIIKLESQKDKLDHMASRLRSRDQELFQQCLGAQLNKDFAHAKLYANECAELRKIAKVVLSSELALEKVILRLETIDEFGTVMAEMAPIMGIVQETKGKIAGVVPQVAGELEEVNSMLNDLSLEAGEMSGTSGPSLEPADEEAKKVLEETSTIAEQRLRDHFPDLPEFESLGHGSPVLETVGEGPVLVMPLEDRVFEYVKKHSCRLDVNTVSTELMAEPDRIKDALLKLSEQGKIRLE
jgi:division protein CdvB (Snf7/Vps24/ESCRT-III family)